MIQNKNKSNADQGKDSNNIALDYYMSGIKIDPRHFGCIYNAACSHFYEKKYNNALKWFEIALKINPESYDSYFGKAITCLKLNNVDQALKTIEILDSMPTLQT